MKDLKHSLLGLMIAGILSTSVPASACTYVNLEGPPNSDVVASARTVDFNVPIDPKMLEVPRGLSWQSRADASGRPGAAWTNQYGFVGLSASSEKNTFLDGINEKGLSVALLWLEETKYMPRKGTNDVAAFDLVPYIIGKYATAMEAREGLKSLNVYGTVLKELDDYKLVIPLHLIVTDASGDSFVAEWLNGRLVILDQSNTKNYIGVLANSLYKEQLRKLAKYKNMSCYNKKNRYSLTGLPGNSSSESRFVRVAKLKQCVERKGGTGDWLIHSQDQALERISQVMGRVDKIEGETVLDPSSPEGTDLSFSRVLLIRIQGKMDAQGHATSKLYYRTPDNQSLRLIDLSKIDFSASKSIGSYHVDSPLYKRAQDAIPISD